MENVITRPVIGIVTDRHRIGPHWKFTAMEKYVWAVIDPVGGLPILIPALGNSLDLEPLVGLLDGLLLTGGYTNVEPHHFGQDRVHEPDLYDPQRDATSLALIRAAMEIDLPLLGICRGLQELNVALGGSLHQAVHLEADFDDHRENENQPMEDQYAPAHEVYILPGGWLEPLSGSRLQRVNSLHGQGIDRLADGLEVEAVSLDGLIEAVRIKQAKRFSLAVQWHPEWQYWTHPFYHRLFTAFGNACRNKGVSALF